MNVRGGRRAAKGSVEVRRYRSYPTGLASVASVSARIACDLVDVCSLEVHYECTEKLSEFTERKNRFKSMMPGWRNW